MNIGLLRLATPVFIALAVVASGVFAKPANAAPCPNNNCNQTPPVYTCPEGSVPSHDAYGSYTPKACVNCDGNHNGQCVGEYYRVREIRYYCAKPRPQEENPVSPITNYDLTYVGSTYASEGSSQGICTPR
jgi:hypothetical protein